MYRKTSTGRCSCDNTAGALKSHTVTSYFWHFLLIREGNSSLAECWGAVVEIQADSKFPFPNPASPSPWRTPPSGSLSQTAVGTLVRGTAAPDCYKTRAVGTRCGAGALSHLIPWGFLVIPGQDVGSRAREICLWISWSWRHRVLYFMNELI